MINALLAAVIADLQGTLGPPLALLTPPGALTTGTQRADLASNPGLPRIVFIPTTVRFTDDAPSYQDQITTRIQRIECHCTAGPSPDGTIDSRTNAEALFADAIASIRNVCGGNAAFVDGSFLSDTTPDLSELGYTIVFSFDANMPVFGQLTPVISISGFNTSVELDAADGSVETTLNYPIAAT